MGADGGFYDERTTGIIVALFQATVTKLLLDAHAYTQRLAVHRAALTAIIEAIDLLLPVRTTRACCAISRTLKAFLWTDAS